MATDDPSRLQASPGKVLPGERLTSSPRIAHYDGEIPPALSPLDAFAAQGRLLAKQFDQSRKDGRRLSRIPPASVARSLSRPRPGYFRSASSEGTREGSKPPLSPAFREHNHLAVEEPKFRPISQHPRLSGLPADQDGGDPRPWGREGVSRSASKDNIAGSPNEEVGLGLGVRDAAGPAGRPLVGVGVTTSKKESHNDPMSRSRSDTLVPPIPLPRSSSSPGLSHTESSDDDYYTSSNAGSTFSKPRKLSSSSGMSMPHSPMSNFTRPNPRSLSPASERSGTPHVLQRPSFNFSRPLSRSSTSISLPSPLTPDPTPNELQPRMMTRDNRPAPINTSERSPLSTQDAEEPPPSATYTYAKYNLPRGREVVRDSIVFSGLQAPHFEWKEPLFESPPPSAVREKFARTPSPSPAKIQQQPTSPPTTQRASPAKTSPARSIKQINRSPAAPSRHSFENDSREVLTLRTPSSSTKVKPKSSDQDDAKSTSANSGSTIRPHTSHKESKPGDNGDNPDQPSAEDYVAKGIACHENGSLKESTYYLRLAAMQNHPTGMLMYALACRHGWGMRPNPQEGVEWLRKAVNSVADITQEVNTADLQPRGKALQEQKARQAQFALSIYELGVSHLNGWGVDQDKTLARRCFEIAGQWGDVDALAEAGYCYAEGVGCKKDLKKAAKYYRMAEAKGMSMVGNSWIYKDKYMGDDEPTLPDANVKSISSSEKQPSRNKSRTRSIFGRKKSNAHDC
ncbi:cell cycle inhibitor Nif1 [Coccidioides immitis RS]|uniref:Cell cycle inhibitor Nif1 n=3 Tax=Coccidioides immitis TaxID=5501 RepID=J3KE54_COCIM|nr:cell cycle inhibitor Nif1 [Coccidioides immitis RS]EAS33723.3 cell cycle inhibitor Nif1 [Coccidioides immitis RS]KMP04915.1 hypothetical protein CIRG_04596 [Coccidioides immitis RMSCC 2394]